ncbi:hypothetical protein [Mycobacterium timonense]|nr:hypothetical protein [Mycobacterium timonense]
MTEIVVSAVIGLVVLSMVLGAVLLIRDSRSRRGYSATLMAIRWWMWPAGFANVILVVAVMSLLWIALPSLRFGWWMLLGGSGNVSLGQTGRSEAIWQAIAWAVPLGLFALMPHLAFQEELAFRYGTDMDSRWAVLRRQTIFGLAHSVFAGVPIAAGIALIGSGMLYAFVYSSTLRRSLARTELVSVRDAPVRLDYPPTPGGPYDPAAWDAHRAEFDRIVLVNRQHLDEWIEESRERAAQREKQIEDLRYGACAVAAAFHSCSNWLIVGALLFWLALR